MDLGLFLPIVNRHPPRVAPDWEDEGRPRDLAAVARAAEEAGCRFLCAPEHVAMPVAKQTTRGDKYWDPISTLGYLAAVTETIELVTYVLPIPYHHPLEIAKRAGTLDHLAGGRVHLGLGTGSLREEFELLGASFEGRGALCDDALRAIRAVRGRTTVSYEGAHFSFADFIVDPGLRADIPIWLGGQTLRSLRRALELAEWWSPVGLAIDAITGLLAAPAARALADQRERPLEIAYYVSDRWVDPLGDPSPVRRVLRDACDAGFAATVFTLDSRSREHYCEQVAALAALRNDETG